MHVGEPGYGVAVANDSTYGHDVGRDDPADGGTDHDRAAVAAARAAASPTRTPTRARTCCGSAAARRRHRRRRGARATTSTCRCGRARARRRSRRSSPSSDPAVVVEAVKLAEDGSGDVVVRLYESLGGRARTTVTAATAVGSVAATDLLERPLPEGGASEGPSIDLELSPFQLVTLRFRR